MASSKTLFFACLLVAAVALPMAQANPTPPNILVIRAQGIVYCTASGNLIGSVSPRFPNANVELRCGAANTTIASGTTDGLGRFSFLFDAAFFNASSIVTNCRVVVTTPLVTCNRALSPIGTLTAPLQLVGVLPNLSFVINIARGSFTLTITL